MISFVNPSSSRDCFREYILGTLPGFQWSIKFITPAVFPKYLEYFFKQNLQIFFKISSPYSVHFYTRYLRNSVQCFEKNVSRKSCRIFSRDSTDYFFAITIIEIWIFPEFFIVLKNVLHKYFCPGNVTGQIV